MKKSPALPAIAVHISQGGFITRKPSEESIIASEDSRYDGFGFFSQRNPNSRRMSFDDFWTQRRR
jgi:hypothetical protein